VVVADEYLCPKCGQPLKNDPENFNGRDQEGQTLPAMGCVEHGLMGRRPDGAIVPVEPIASDIE
jgi:hypothetical protein